MELSGEYTIDAPRQKVWEALNDADVLKQCIPGCEEIEQSDENEFSAKVKAKVGPVNARFSGKVTLSNLNPPESYTISGEGSGGAAGFAKGGADVHLEELSPEQTKLSYKVDAQVGGKLAQLGQRLIQSTANKYAKQFFDKFEEIVGKPKESEGAAAESGAGSEAPASSAAAQTAADGASAQAESQAASQSGSGAATGASSSTGSAGAGQGKPAESGGGIPQTVWIGGAVAVVVVLLLIFAL